MGARVDRETVAVGGPAHLRERNLMVPTELQSEVDEWSNRGAALLNVVSGTRVIASLLSKMKFGRSPVRRSTSSMRPE